MITADIRLLQDLRDPTTDIRKSNPGLYHRYCTGSSVSGDIGQNPEEFTVPHAGRKHPCKF